MKIAFLVGNSLNNGGAERVTVSLANEMSVIGHELFLLTGSKGSKEYELNRRIKRFIVFYGNIINNSLRIARIVKKYNIDAVIGMGLYANFSACILKLLVKVKIIISERNDPVNDLISKKSRLLRYLIYPLADGYVFQTNKAKEFYSKSIQKRSIVIHNPIKSDLTIKSKTDKKEIVAVGRLNRQKNYPLLLKAFSVVHEKYPDYILRIFGQGNELSKLQKITETLNLKDNVVFEGFSSNVHDLIKDSQIFVMTSDFEGMPNSLMEAMAMGFPVISTDCPSGGPKELIINGNNGLLIPTNDVPSLINAIFTLIESKDTSAILAKNARHVAFTHSVNKIVKIWLDFIVLVNKKGYIYN